MPPELAFQATIDDAVRDLVGVDHRKGSAFIRTPLLYPSGSNVVIRVDDRGKSFFATDMALGYQEADLMGAAIIYARHARPIAENSGVGFDSESFFVEASAQQLSGAITTVANCSCNSVALAAYKLSERRASDLAEELYERLVKIFSPRKVAKNAPIFGASNTEYHFAAVVRANQRPAVFEAVANHPTSIAFASSKFHDIALLDDPPVAIAVVRTKKELGTYHNLLAQVANVIETNVSDERITKLASAA